MLLWGPQMFVSYRLRKPVLMILLLTCGLLAMSDVAHACDLQLEKLAVPLAGTNFPNDLCIESYFEQRDLGRMSLGANEQTGAYFFRDQSKMDFNDLAIFKRLAPNPPAVLAPMGLDGREALLKKIYGIYLKSLRSDSGACELQLSANGQPRSLEDFTFSERLEEGQPGTRLSIMSDGSFDPSWEMLCQGSDGQKHVEKSGSYFFLFIDVYDNVDASAFLRDNLAQWLMSFR